MNINDLLMAIYCRIDLEQLRRHGRQEFVDGLASKAMYAYKDNKDGKFSTQALKLLSEFWPSNNTCMEPGQQERTCMAFLNKIIQQSSREILDEAIRRRPHEAQAENWEGMWTELQEG